MRLKYKSASYSNLAYSSIVILLCCLVVQSCSGGGGSQQGKSADGSDQQFIGTFVDSSGSPLVSSQVTILNSGETAVADGSGVAEIYPAVDLTGDIRIQVSRPWGTATVVLSNIQANAKIITYQVQVSDSDYNATLISLHVTPPGPYSVANSEMCLSCHDVLGDAKCGNTFWEDIHGNFFNCDQNGPTSVGSSCTGCHEYLGSPRCGDPAWVNLHLGFYSCEEGVSCVSCHENRGAPQCGDSRWRGYHDSVYNCGGKTCTSCHENRGGPDCNSQSWLVNHTGIYSCGFGCTACHADQGLPLCGDSHFESAHAGVFTCYGTDDSKCKTCHGNDRVWPECNNASWKQLHSPIYNCSKDRNGGTDNCTACHTTKFTEPFCGRLTEWERSHSFYPCGDLDDDGGSDGGGTVDSRCTPCHSKAVEPKCGNSSWESIHGSIYTCP